MATRDWEFMLNRKQHRLKLVHGVGRRRFFLDEKLLLEQKDLKNNQISYSFEIDSHVCEINIHKIWMEYFYSFFLNEELIPSIQDQKWRKKPQNDRYASQRIYWAELARTLNLKPIPLHPELGFLGRPLLGELGGFLILIYFGVSNQNTPLVYVLVRYRPVNDTQSIKTDLTQLFSHAGIIRKSPGWLISELANDRLVIYRSFEPTKIKANQLKESLVDIIGLLAKHTSGVSPFRCENSSCNNPADTNLKLVLINRNPIWMCAACIAELDTLGERTKEDYKQAPLNFGRGLMAGVLAAFAGSLLWAAFMILFEQIAAIFAALILVGVVKAMDWVKTKRTFWSILTAGFLSVGGSILGSYLGGLWTTVSKSGVSLTFIFESVEIFFWYLGFVWTGLWEKTTIMGTTIMFSVLGVGLYLWSFWSSHRKSLQQAFKPEIHVVE